MKGFSILVHALLACLSVAAALPDIKSNKVATDGNQKLLKDLNSYVHDALTKIQNLRANLVLKRGIGNLISNSQGRQCNDAASILKALDEDIKEVQALQLKESTIATSSNNIVAVNAPSNYVDNYRKIEYILRDIASKLRKLAKEYKITNLPKYTVGLSHKEVLDIQKEKIVAAQANEQAYQKLTAIRKCMKVFKKKFIASRLLTDPFHANSIDNHAYLGQEYDLSSNDIFHNLYEHPNYQH